MPPSESLAEVTDRIAKRFAAHKRFLDERPSSPPPPIPEAPALTAERAREIKMLMLKSNNLLSICQCIGVTPAELGQVLDAARRAL